LLTTRFGSGFEPRGRRAHPGAITLPSMPTGATDHSQLRAKGVRAYGFGPIVDEKQAAGGGGAHGDDERLKETSLYKEVEFIWRSVLRVAASN
jgi:acetylornithine deacetylase/succinyl-diaminopimelate desuccinylase-like protein